MSEKPKPRYRTFVLAGNIPRWKVFLIVIALLLVAFWGTDYYTYKLALDDLRYTPDLISKDGVIMQMTDYACAPASLAMLMREQGIVVTTYDMAKSAYTGIFGTWSRAIPIVGREYGFKVTEKWMDYNEIIDTNLPMIIIERDGSSVHAVYAVPDLASRILHVKDPSVGYSIFDERNFYMYFTPRLKKNCFVFDTIKNPSD